jgi:hypothetical protein
LIFKHFHGGGNAKIYLVSKIKQGVFMRRFVLAAMVVFGMVSMANAAEVKNTYGTGDSKLNACVEAKKQASREADSAKKTIVSFGECECDKKDYYPWKCAVDYKVVSNN